MLVLQKDARKLLDTYPFPGNDSTNILVVVGDQEHLLVSLVRGQMEPELHWNRVINKPSTYLLSRPLMLSRKFLYSLGHFFLLFFPLSFLEVEQSSNPFVL